jgi:transcriptional regulator with XRE-family HTH domain
MTKQTSIEFGRKLKILRFQINASQSLIAQQLEMTQQGYSYLENGKTHFTDALIEKICVIFGISFQEFVTINNQPKKGKLISKANDAEFDEYSARVTIANFKKQLVEKDLRIVQLELLLITNRQEHNSTSVAKPVYVLI